MGLVLKIKKAIEEKRLIKTLNKKIYPYFKGFLLIFNNKNKNIKIHITNNKAIDKNDIPLAKRIFNSFKRMKADQLKHSDVYKPSSLWQSHIEKDFKFLNDSLKSNDIEKFLFFLQNFGNWDNYLGIEDQNLIKSFNKNPFLRTFLLKEIFGNQLNLWEYFNKDSNISELEMPLHGNQIGVKIQNKFMVMGSFSNDIYAKNLAHYFEKQENRIIEIGGGYGKFAYYLLKRLENFNYVDFDIPETLVLASYYLSKSFSNKKNFFYGEEEFSNKIIKEFDLIFLPPWEIDKVAEDSINLAINKNSLGEMDPNTAKNFIDNIHRTSKYFFSMNHEYYRNIFQNGQKSLINREYNLDGKFKQLIRYPDLGHLTYERNKIDSGVNTFFYIYEKNQ